VASVDHIVHGKVEALRWTRDAPTVNPNGGPTESCSTLEHLLEIDLRVDRAVLGTGIAVGDVVTLAVGIGVRDSWQPRPLPDDANNLTLWTSDVDNIVFGQEIGFALHREPTTQALSPLLEPMFLVRPSGVEFSSVRAQCTGDPVVTDADFSAITDLDDFTARAGACSSSARADERRAAITGDRFLEQCCTARCFDD
jgi:hypothetical protein